MITSLFRPRSVVNRVVEDPREPDCPRTPKNEWKPRTDFEGWEKKVFVDLCRSALQCWFARHDLFSNWILFF